MTVSLARAGFDTISVEALTGADGQGKPTYDSPIDIVGRVVWETNVVRSTNGTEIKTMATIWVTGDTTPIPNEQDRLTMTNGKIGIVVDRTEGRAMDQTLDHVRLMIRAV